ncbi:hypothetical protein A2875_04860 [Candidatus Gottesmanbacteria bacterium RIFCSPHIGHO2_01_FULL_46_14]|uniref:Uncharacterized protein n=3 Tax=Candidatus Gottesmaniibacteriota TaxID=1752720 RepID=A0A1F5ZQ03_9BACT|nr:MAG: hypothetical protein UY08_C0010G0012 [Candidatus Gottesmanbacteria bacterium GW2011_GWA1_47_8]OGG14192.1 MAG: hypothetical protein A2875_04860 [Candidatus Gottesmanbacteria bacterium RIFCSPHIGHO2_01_FULL_46_14]OGG29437.1 MAG: hypothetical protein A2971_02610 [Candidatus Gottesmanbacteria bacterium RIFCSPLOWO2_01_FULL_46_21]
MKILAQLRNPVLPPALGGGANPNISAGGAGVGGLISALVGGMFIVAFFMTMFYLISGAIFWITSEGEKSNLEGARKRITHAIIGLIVIGSIWAIMTLVGDFFGLDFEHLPIPSLQSQPAGVGGGGPRVR